MSLVSVENIGFRYKGAESFALDGVSFNIAPGEFVCIAGLAGSGKTTLMRLLKTSIHPDGEIFGSVRFCGTPLSQIPACQQAACIGYVMQNPEAQIVSDRVGDELAFGMENLGMSPSIMRSRVAEIANYFGMQKLIDAHTDNLSGGQKQLLNLASAMVMQPDLLLLDEPVSQLDPVSAFAFSDAIKRLNRELGIAVVVTAHGLEGIAEAADKIYALENGRICVAGTMDKAVSEMLSTGGSMAQTVPVPSQIYNSVQVSSPETCSIPVSVREGKRWLREHVSLHPPVRTAFPVKHFAEPKKGASISVKDILFAYDDSSTAATGAQPYILRRLSCNIPAGNVFAFLGGNGSGKTTLLKCIAGILKPQRGRIRLDGKPMRNFTHGVNPHQSVPVAFLPQDVTCLFAKDTVLQELEEVASLPEEAHRIAFEMGLDGQLLEDPFHLSGGQQQKLAIAKVLLCNPQILLLDEPTKGLDVVSKNWIAKVLRSLADEGRTVVLASHDTEFCASHADVCAMLFDGTVACVDYSREFFSSNAFYTTAASRMAHGIFENVATKEDVVELCQS